MSGNGPKRPPTEQQRTNKTKVAQTDKKPVKPPKDKKKDA